MNIPSKIALRSALLRDACDSLNDAEILTELLAARLAEVQS
jgi:hypothetical protein